MPMMVHVPLPAFQVGPGSTPKPRSDEVRVLRAVAVLDAIGTAEAKRLVRELAAGDPAALITREAKAALGRLRE